MKKLIIGAISAAVLTTGIAFAGGHLPQEKRQMAMEEVGKNMGIVAKMAKGETEFDGSAAQTAFTDMKAAIEGWTDLFPEGSETGAETEASPKIFSDRAGFEAKFSDFEAALVQASASAPADAAALGAMVGMVGKNCGACHKDYRVKKE